MIGIIFISDIKYCPYLTRYTEILDKEQIKYEILFWNRVDNSSIYPENYLSFNFNSNLNKHPLLKLVDFLKFRIWLSKKLKDKKYEKLIILSTLSGIIISNILKKSFKGKYIFDIRDYSYENIQLFYKIEETLIRNSAFTSISSDGFKTFLPKEYSYLSVHNFNQSELIHKRKFNKKVNGEPLNLVFIGGVRYFNHQSQIISKLKNDKRFNLIYHGSGVELDKFISYCKNENINNVTFTGEYNNIDKYKLLANADILNNSYQTEKVMEVKYAISNKFYDGLIYGIPQLVEPETYKQKIVEENYLGIGLDVNDIDFSNKLYDFYFSLDEERFNYNCDKYLEKIIDEDKFYISKIKSFINT